MMAFSRAPARAGGVLEQQIRRAMRGNHPHLVRDLRGDRVFRGPRIVSQSDDEPMMMPTKTVMAKLV